MASQNNTIGYMVIEGSEGQLRGIALVTDNEGKPVDYRYTGLISPKKLEEILYGDSWNTYFKQEVILQSILEVVNVPDVWICQDREILEPVYSISKVKTVLLEEFHYAPVYAAGSVVSTEESGVFLIHVAAGKRPYKATFPKDIRSYEIPAVASILTEYAETMNLLEPFMRIKRLSNTL